MAAPVSPTASGLGSFTTAGFFAVAGAAAPAAAEAAAAADPSSHHGRAGGQPSICRAAAHKRAVVSDCDCPTDMMT